MQQPSYNWTTTQIPVPQKDSPTIYSAFSGIGGDVFGFRLAGFRALGACDIDNKALKLFKAYHNPEHTHHKPIKRLLKDSAIIEIIKGVDVLLASPSLPTMASLNKGEVNSIDDTLALTQATRPSTLVVFTDNTLSYDKFKFYLSQTIKSLNNLGYECHSYLLDTVDFGVAQKQDFSCIIATRIINPAPISIIPTTPRSQERVTVRQALKSLDQPAPLPPKHYAYSSHEIIKKYHKLVNKGGNYGHVFQQLRNSRTYTNWTKIDDQSPSFKLTTLPLLTHYLEPRFLTLKEYISLSSFPQDIRFDNEQVTNEDSQQTGKYLIGSSVPPFLALAVGKALKPLYIQTST